MRGVLLIRQSGGRGMNLRVVWAAAALAAIVQPASAQQYPSQPVRIVVPFSAGSNTDAQARILADKLSQMWKQQVIVENRPGIAGTASVAKSPRRRLHADADLERPSGRQRDQPGGAVRSGQGFRRCDPGVVGVGLVCRAARIAGEESQGVHRAGAAEAGQAELRLGRHRQHLLSCGRDLQAGRQGQHRARALQGRAGGHEQHHAQRHAALFRQHHVLARPDRRPRRSRYLAVSSAKRAPRLPDVPTVGESGVARLRV